MLNKWKSSHFCEFAVLKTNRKCFSQTTTDTWWVSKTTTDTWWVSQITTDTWWVSKTTTDTWWVSQTTTDTWWVSQTTTDTWCFFHNLFQSLTHYWGCHWKDLSIYQSVEINIGQGFLFIVLMTETERLNKKNKDLHKAATMYCCSLPLGVPNRRLCPLTD